MTTSSTVNSAAIDALLQSLDADTSIDAIYRVHTVAKMLHKDGAYAAARRLSERALEVCEATLGPDHQLTRSSLYQLIGISTKQNDHPSAGYFYGRLWESLHRSRH
jgi:hypothetical protein